MNQEGGYDLYYTQNFLDNPFAPGADEAFERALIDWRCLTDVNFVIKDSSDIAPPIALGCQIDFGDLPTGVETTLAQFSPTHSSCVNGQDTLLYRMQRFNMFFNQNLSWYTDEDDSFDLTGTGLRDFQSRAAHELGHAHGMKHCNNKNDLMYWKDIVEPLSYRREILSNDESGGLTIVNSSAFDPLPNGCSSVNFQNMIIIGDCIEGIPTSLIDDLEENLRFQIFPNPFINQIEIQFEQEKCENCQIHIFNAIGQLVKTSSIEQNNVIVNIGNINSGIYYLQIENGASILAYYKLLKL